MLLQGFSHTRCQLSSLLLPTGSTSFIRKTASVLRNSYSFQLGPVSVSCDKTRKRRGSRSTTERNMEHVVRMLKKVVAAEKTRAGFDDIFPNPLLAFPGSFYGLEQICDILHEECRPVLVSLPLWLHRKGLFFSTNSNVQIRLAESLRKPCWVAVQKLPPLIHICTTDHIESDRNCQCSSTWIGSSLGLTEDHRR